MPIISSRPQVIEDDAPQFDVDDVVDMIGDGVSASVPGNVLELRLILEAICRTLQNVAVIDDYYIYDTPFSSNGFDVGFKITGDLGFNVVLIN